MENQHPTHELSLEDWERVLKVNLTGVFIGTKAALNYFTENNKKEISSICLLFMNRSHGQRLLITLLQKGGKIIYRNGSNGVCTEGIRINSIGPGAIRTPINAAKFDDPEQKNSWKV